MIAFVKRLWAAAPVATAVLALALAFGAFFAVRMVAFWIYWHDPEHRHQQIEPWMTPRFISHSWQLPRELVLEAIGAPPRPDHLMNLEEIAQAQGVPPEELVARLEAAIAAFRADQAPPAAGEARP